MPDERHVGASGLTRSRWHAGLAHLVLLACAAVSAGCAIVPAGSLPVQSSTKAYPPWGRTPQGGRSFVVSDIDNVPDLYGDITNPDLVLFLAGNQFMVVPDLIDAFRAEHPQYQRIFVETLPPGILASQIEQGALVLSNLKIDLKPDVYAAGAPRITQMQQATGIFDTTVAYADNRLAIMVRRGNPAQVHTLTDLGNAAVRVSMPNPAWEGIARQIEDMYRRAGGQALDDRIMKTKVADGTTVLTQIHHRQTPIRLMLGQADAGPTWYTEAFFQHMIGNPVDLVTIPDSSNLRVTYVAASLKAAPHPQAARDFITFMQSPRAQAVYRKYGFLPVAAQPAAASTAAGTQNVSLSHKPTVIRP
jgi:ABC-type molybdate transport system substrate-binding protein